MYQYHDTRAACTATRTQYPPHTSFANESRGIVRQPRCSPVSLSNLINDLITHQNLSNVVHQQIMTLSVFPLVNY